MAHQQTRETFGHSTPGSGRRGESDAGSLSDQVTGGLSGVAEGASELWDDAYEQGRRYYRQGSEAVGQVDTTMLSGWLIAGAIGFGVAWLLFGPYSRSASDMTRRMSESSDRPSGEYRGRSRRQR